MLKWLVIRLFQLFVALMFGAIALIYGLIWDHRTFGLSRMKEMIVDLYDITIQGM